jgi:hypothetical protein
MAIYRKYGNKQNKLETNRLRILLFSSSDFQDANKKCHGFGQCFLMVIFQKKHSGSRN